MGNQQPRERVTTAYYHTDPNYQPPHQNQSRTVQPYAEHQLSNSFQQQSSRQQNQVPSGSDSHRSQQEQAKSSQSGLQQQQMNPPNQAQPPTGYQQPSPNQQQPPPTYQGQQPPPYQGQQPPPYQGQPYGAAQQPVPSQTNPYGAVPPAAFGKVIFVHSNQANSPYRSGRNDFVSSERVEEAQNNNNDQWSSFSNKKIRRIFIRKVYFILTLQLLFTLGMICLFIFEPNVKDFVRVNPIVYYVSLAVFFVVFLSLVCFQSLRRSFPLNLVMLFIFTLAMSILMGTISSFHDTDVVLIAVGICAAVCLAVTLFSFHTKFDMTNCGGLLCVLLLILIMFGLVAIFTKSKLVIMIYAGLGATIFMMYLAYDTQMIMGGKHLEISPEEYILAALMLYIDIVYIYMFILMLMGYAN